MASAVGLRQENGRFWAAASTDPTGSIPGAGVSIDSRENQLI
jgi:hypothetical protein